MGEASLALSPKARALMALHEAALAVTGQLDLDKTLQHIVDSARSLVRARYAALGVFDGSSRLHTFVYSGLDRDKAAEIPHPPLGQGLLGAIMREKKPVRLERLDEDPRAYGFPPGHPVMTSFLGVPILAGDGEVLGNLYLADKEGGEAFSAEDQEVIEILATHAAVAIRNARLYQASLEHARELEEQNRALATLSSLTRELGQQANLDEALIEALDRVLELTGMEAGEVFLLDESTRELVLAVHRGPASEAFYTIPRFRLGEGFPGIVAETGRPLYTDDLAQEERYLRREVVAAGFQTYVCVPLKAKRGVLGVLSLASRSKRVFGPRDLATLEAIGNHVGTVVENVRLYEEMGRLAVVEERARIGMDLHDGVIQSIYAVGLTLETVRLLMETDPERARAMLDQAVQGLNEAIRDMRNFILDLRPRRFEGDLEAGLARLVREFQANTMVVVDFQAEAGDLRTVPPAVARALFLTTQEALANVARHARASRVVVRLERQDGHIHLTVEDDGRGFDVAAQRLSVGHGLSNMQSRAEALRGHFQVTSAPGKGTKVHIALPLPCD